ncbi:hypothetical protein [Scytonema sp. NUACC26]|uniref:hypothetical protein n=1 Tax=Scytonema sp. NUACC26 TaxID=3140176 RepID=UPI0034DCB624
MASTPIEKESAFLEEVQKFRRERVSKLRIINHWWNITLTVAGITLTAVTTVLGVIDSQDYKDLIKFGIAISGSVGVLSQSANKEFRVKGKAGEYAQVEAELLVIEQKIKNAQNGEALTKLYEEFYAIIHKVGKIECETEQDKS